MGPSGELRSVLNLPTFEETPSEIRATLNASLTAANAALADVLALSSSSAIQVEKSFMDLTFDNTLGGKYHVVATMGHAPQNV